MVVFQGRSKDFNLKNSRFPGLKPCPESYICYVEDGPRAAIGCGLTPESAKAIAFRYLPKDLNRRRAYGVFRR